MRLNIFLILLLICALSIPIFSQTKSVWQISAGRNYGRFHQFGENITVKSSGEVFLFNKEKKTTRKLPINAAQINEIGEMLRLLNLPAAKKIPGDKFNACIVSPHLPAVYFSLKQNDKTYGLTHCNSRPGNQTYKYTLMLNDKQSEIYQNLRKKITAFVEEKSAEGQQNPISQIYWKVVHSETINLHE